jgi:hypothetical protein
VRSSLLVVALAALMLGTACYRDTSNLTTSGMGKPIVSVDFPATVEAGSVHTAELRVDNPGPGDIQVLIVSFSALGSPTEGMHDPLVEVGRGDHSPSVVGVDPAPEDVSEGGTIYRFEGLDVDDSKTISFRLRAPEVGGVVANSLIVYDGTEVQRAKGVRIETRVRA